MHPAATLFLDVCVQRDFWPEGEWPVVGNEEARNITRLFAIAAELEIRQGGVVCRHVTAGTAPALETPLHCRGEESWRDRPLGCTTTLPMQVWTEPGASLAETLDRTRAFYLDSGCGEIPDGVPYRTRAFCHLTAGIRDAIVFGAGIEHGLDRVVNALLRRRIRTHVALDAAGTADAIRAQAVVARWKRRGVDGATVDTLHRILHRG